MAAASKRRWRFAIGASAVAHAAVFLALFWNFGSTPRSAQAPVMDVMLMRSREPPRPPARDHKAATAVPTPPSSAAPSPPPTPETETTVAVAPLPGGVQAALRARVGCSHAALLGLTRAERQDCLDRLAHSEVAELGKIPAALNFDRRGEYARNPEPYLLRKPKNNCRPRAAGEVANPRLGIEGAEFGVGCALSF